MDAAEVAGAAANGDGTGAPVAMEIDGGDGPPATRSAGALGEETSEEEADALATLVGLANGGVVDGAEPAAAARVSEIGELIESRDGRAFYASCTKADGTEVKTGEHWYVMPRKGDVHLYISSVEAIFTKDWDPKKDIWLSLRWFYRPYDVFADGQVPDELRGDILENEIFRTDYTDEQRIESIGARCSILMGPISGAGPERWDRAQFSYICRRSYHAQSKQLSPIPGPPAGGGAGTALRLGELDDRLRKVGPRTVSPGDSGRDGSPPKGPVLPGAKNVEKAQELAVDLLRFESSVPRAKFTAAWRVTRQGWTEAVRGAQSIRDLARALLELEEGVDIQNYRDNSDFSDLSSWRVRVAGLHTYASIEYHIKAYASEVASHLGMTLGDLGILPFSRGGRKSSAPKAGANGAEAPVAVSAPQRAVLTGRSTAGPPVALLPADDETRKAITQYLGITRSAGGRPRWSMERYMRGFKFLRDVLLRSGSGSKSRALPRPTLREEARKKVGDTGLLDHLLKHMVDLPYEGCTIRRHEGHGGLFGYWIESEGRTGEPSGGGGGLGGIQTTGAAALAAVRRGHQADSGMQHELEDEDDLPLNLRPPRQLHRLKRKGAAADEEETDTEDERTPMKAQRKRKRRENKALAARLLGTVRADAPRPARAPDRTIAGRGAAPAGQRQVAQQGQQLAIDAMHAGLVQLRNEGGAQLQSIKSDMAVFREAFVGMAGVMKSIQEELRESNRLLRAVVPQAVAPPQPQPQPQPQQLPPAPVQQAAAGGSGAMVTDAMVTDAPTTAETRAGEIPGFMGAPAAPIVHVQAPFGGPAGPAPAYE